MREAYPRSDPAVSPRGGMVGRAELAAPVKQVAAQARSLAK